MVKLKELEEFVWEPPEQPWFRIEYTTEKQEDAIREYAKAEGFETLRGYWSHLNSIGWDYYDVLKDASP